MTTIQINHPHAQTAVLLASFNRRDRRYVAETLSLSGCPRSLYTLACGLRAGRVAPQPTAKPAHSAGGR